MVTPTIAPWQVWWVDFDPQLGREQAGRRRAIVVGTPLACRLPNQLAFVIPCTRTVRDLPTQPVIQLDGQRCVALCEHLRSVDRTRLKKPHGATLDPAEIEAIRFVLRQLIDVD